MQRILSRPVQETEVETTVYITGSNLCIRISCRKVRIVLSYSKCQVLVAGYFIFEISSIDHQICFFTFCILSSGKRHPVRRFECIQSFINRIQSLISTSCLCCSHFSFHPFMPMIKNIFFIKFQVCT